MKIIYLIVIFTVGIAPFYFLNVYSASSNPNLYVSAENPSTQNHFAGSMVIQVVVNDPNLLDTDQGKGEPDVTLNGKKLRMVQATDGQWYAYFANLDKAKKADQIYNGAMEGKGLDFGVFCSRNTDSSVLGTSFSDTEGVAVPRKTGLSGYTNGDSSFSACTGSPSGDSINNVVRYPSFLNTNPAIPSGQIGLKQDAWPIIQLFSFSNNVVIKYNRAGGEQTVTLSYNEIPNISINLDRDTYPTNSEVFITLNDFQLNQDPTSVDSWTFNIDSPLATFYQAFDESGSQSAAGTSALVNLVPYLSNLGFEKNAKFTMKLNNVAVLKTNNEQPQSTINNGGPNTYSKIVTFVESSPNSGIFENFDYSNKANVGISANAPRGNAATMEYDSNSKSILTGSSTASLKFDFKSVTLKPGQRTPITLIDNDQNLNPGSKDDLDVFRSSAMIPTLKIGNPITLEKASDVKAYPLSGSAYSSGTSISSSVPDTKSDRLILNTQSIGPTTFQKLSINLGITAADLKSKLIAVNAPTIQGTNWINYDFRSLQKQLGVSSFSDTSIELHFGSLGSSVVTIASPGSLSGAQGLLKIDPSDISTIFSSSGQAFLVIKFGSVTGSISSETDTQPIVFDLFSFGLNNNKEINNAIYRFELRETSSDSGTFTGTIEYVITNQLNIFDENLVKSLRPISNDVKFLVNQKLVDEKGIAISYSDLGQAGVNVDVSTKSNIVTHSGTVGLGAPSYRFGQPVTVILNDPDLNLDSDTIEVYNVVDNPTLSSVDTVGDSNGNILLEVLIKDTRYKRCTVDGIQYGGLASTGFSLVETGTSTGIFQGSFKMPSKICDSKGTKLISAAGGTIDLKYYDYRDSSGKSNIFTTGRTNMQSNDSQQITLNSQEFILPKNLDTVDAIISGKIGNYQQGMPLEVTLTDPSGNSKSLSAFPTPQGSYKVMVTLSSTSLPGTYSVVLKYKNQEYGSTSFDVIKYVIPSWIKNNALWWSEDKITEQDFVKGIESLVKEDIIKIPKTDAGVNTQTTVPEWIKTTSKWWSKNLISDDEFVSAIEYLIKKGIIQV